MTRRTAADFAAEATADPYELVLSDDTVITPRPRSHWTYPERELHAQNELAWAEGIFYREGDVKVLETTSMMAIKLRLTAPGVYVALAKTQERNGGSKIGPLKLKYTDPEAYVAWVAEQETDAEGNQPGPGPDAPLPGFDQFWAEFSPVLPAGPDAKPEAPVHESGPKKGEPTGEPAPKDYGIAGLMREIDEHYVPATPAGLAERAAAAADPDGVAAGKLLADARS